MVEHGEDRLQLRLKHALVLGGGALFGVLLPAGALGSDASRLLTTFMGFFTAGVLPTISILIGSVNAAGRSVKALGEVFTEIKKVVAALFNLLTLAGATVLVMLLMSMPFGPISILVPTGSTGQWVSYLPSTTVSAEGATIDLVALANRFGQVVVCALVAFFVFKAFALPAALYAALNSKEQLAVDEARRSLEDKAPKPSDVKKGFGSGIEFGTVVRLDQ